MGQKGYEMKKAAGSTNLKSKISNLKSPLPYPVLFWTVLIVLIASAPYLVAISAEPPGAHFSGYVLNVDDDCVYGSWIRQIADGNWLIRNQFTTEPQRALQFNVFFLLLGLVARVGHLSPAAVFHIARILLGVALLLVVWKFSERFLKDREERLLVIPIVGLSAGLGWIVPFMPGFQGPVDQWQTEAITFLSLYGNPLFLVGLILMIRAIHFLFKMEESGSWRDAGMAGLMLLLLGNIHTYDVLTVGAVWTAYLVVEAVCQRRIAWRSIGMSAAAAAISLPALGYQYYLYSHESVFRTRVGTPTLSPAFWAYLAGYGFVLILAAFGAWFALKERRQALILVVWSVVGFLMPYAPIAQQRKLVMGLHIPLAILATVAVAMIARRSGPKWGGIAAIVLVTAMIPSNLTFMARDIEFIGESRLAPYPGVYIPDSELRAMQWLRDHTKRANTVLAFPETARFVPSIAGNQVYYGHWSETPDYRGKIREWAQFADLTTPDEWRRAYLKRTGARYIIYPAHPAGIIIQISPTSVMSIFDLRSAPYAKVVFESGDTAVYEAR